MRIVSLFARWIYDDCVPRHNRNTGSGPCQAKLLRHYATTIFTDASFYNCRAEERKRRF